MQYAYNYTVMYLPQDDIARGNITFSEKDGLQRLIELQYSIVEPLVDGGTDIEYRNGKAFIRVNENSPEDLSEAENGAVLMTVHVLKAGMEAINGRRETLGGPIERRAAKIEAVVKYKTEWNGEIVS